MGNLFLRVNFEDDGAFGPGKARLLELVGETGSIRRAAVAMKMSYRQAWLLLAAAEEIFRAPLLSRATGGEAGGGAHLTALGRRVVQHYRAMELHARRATLRDLQAFERMRAR